MIAARKGSPLAIGHGDGENYIGSDAIALAPFYRHNHLSRRRRLGGIEPQSGINSRTALAMKSVARKTKINCLRIDGR